MEDLVLSLRVALAKNALEAEISSRASTGDYIDEPTCYPKYTGIQLQKKKTVATESNNRHFPNLQIRRWRVR